eukprot:13104208-Alexandrium_andersonii.AAC.3
MSASSRVLARGDPVVDAPVLAERVALPDQRCRSPDAPRDALGHAVAGDGGLHGVHDPHRHDHGLVLRPPDEQRARLQRSLDGAVGVRRVEVRRVLRDARRRPDALYEGAEAPASSSHRLVDDAAQRVEDLQALNDRQRIPRGDHHLVDLVVLQRLAAREAQRLE